MSPIGSFRAIHCGGPLITDGRAVTALCLLFERVFLPGNMNLLTDFAATHRFSRSYKEHLQKEWSKNFKIGSTNAIKISLGGVAEDLSGLSAEQKATVEDYFLYYFFFLMGNRELIGNVLETDIIDETDEFKITANETGKGRVSCIVSPGLRFRPAENENISNLLESGYVPVAVNATGLKRKTRMTVPEVATLLAMRSVQMVFPSFSSAAPADILEARERLKDHLPPFWASMLRLSSELSNRINENMGPKDIVREADSVVNAIVRPSAIELKKKIELERKSWFKKVLGPAAETVKLLFGKPGLTQHDLLTAAMLLGVNATSTAVEQIRIVDSLRNDSGLTYLLELEKMVSS